MFLFNKQTPEIEKLPKKRREAICEMLRRCPTNLARLRHPQLLTIEHLVEETRCVWTHTTLDTYCYTVIYLQKYFVCSCVFELQSVYLRVSIPQYTSVYLSNDDVN